MARRAAPRLLVTAAGIALALLQNKALLVLGCLVLVVVVGLTLSRSSTWSHYVRTGERGVTDSSSIAPDHTRSRGFAAEPGDLSVVLESVGSRKINVIKVLRQATGQDLREAKTRVEQAETVGAVVAEGLSQASADRLVALLAEQGAGARTV